MNKRQTKEQALREVGALNADPDRVSAPLFQTHPFFDPWDKVQVKYEMLRCREVEGEPLQKTCRRFGFTRESYRQIVKRFRTQGVFGLFERKRGRKGPLKAVERVREYLRGQRQEHPQLGVEELARRCQEETGVLLSRRSVYRVLASLGQEKKKLRSPGPAKSRER